MFFAGCELVRGVPERSGPGPRRGRGGTVFTGLQVYRNTGIQVWASTRHEARGVGGFVVFAKDFVSLKISTCGQKKG